MNRHPSETWRQTWRQPAEPRGPGAGAPLSTPRGNRTLAPRRAPAGALARRAPRFPRTLRQGSRRSPWTSRGEAVFRVGGRSALVPMARSPPVAHRSSTGCGPVAGGASGRRLPGPRDPTCQGASAPCPIAAGDASPVATGCARVVPGSFHPHTCSRSTVARAPRARVLPIRGPSAPGSKTRGGPRVGPLGEASRLTHLPGEEGPEHDPRAPRSPCAQRRLRRPQGAEAPWHDHNLGPGNGLNQR